MAILAIETSLVRVQPGEPVTGECDVILHDRKGTGRVIVGGETAYEVALRLLEKCTSRELRVLELNQLRVLKKRAAAREAEPPRACPACGVAVAAE